MKSTMNSRDISRYHKLLEVGTEIKICSQDLKVTVATLEKFTPEICAAASKKKAEIAAAGGMLAYKKAKAAEKKAAEGKPSPKSAAAKKE